MLPEIVQINKLIEKKRIRYSKALQELEKRRKEIILSCPRTGHTFYPDASGTNDSEFECNDCGVRYSRAHP